MNRPYVYIGGYIECVERYLWYNKHMDRILNGLEKKTLDYAMAIIYVSNRGKSNGCVIIITIITENLATAAKSYDFSISSSALPSFAGLLAEGCVPQTKCCYDPKNNVGYPIWYTCHFGRLWKHTHWNFLWELWNKK